MLERIKKLFGLGAKTDYKQLIKDGAIVVDVRSKGEFDSGHVKGAINIPVDELGNNLARLKDKNRTIITCCASGMRSAAAKSILKGKGYAVVYNGGSWKSMQQYA